jgi:transposase
MTETTTVQSTNFQLLTDSQWDLIKDLFHSPVKRSRGKPHCSWRSVMNSILHVLHFGGKWGTLARTPDYASKSSAHRWFLLWDKSGFLTQALDRLKDTTCVTISFPPRRNKTVAEESKALVINM